MSVHIFVEIMVWLLSVLTPSGVIAFLLLQIRAWNYERKLVLLLTQRHIQLESQQYIDAKSITAGAYDTLFNHWYVPYKELGGNGLADRLMRQVGDLEVLDED